MDLNAVAAGLATLALAGPAAGSAQAPPAPARYAEHYFESGGVRIRYVTGGDGLPVLLVHGFGVGAELNWVVPGVFDSLTARFRVIVPDLRGHGGSDKPHDVNAYGERFVTDLLGLLDHLGVERVDVVGYSFGSVITLKLLVDHPERVRRAVLGGAGWQPPARRPPAWQAGWIERLDRAGRESTSVALALQRPDVPAYPPQLTAALDRNDPRALAAALRSRSRLAVSEAELRVSAVPILALVGELDGEARADIAALAGVAAGVTVTVIPGANHVSAVTDPLFSKSITAFFSSPSGRQR